MNEQKTRCAAEAERGRLAREQALRHGKTKEADLYARKLAEKTACVAVAAREIAPLHGPPPGHPVARRQGWRGYEAFVEHSSRYAATRGGPLTLRCQT